jgi:hypothetical protein
MPTGARRARVARTMPVTVDHGQQLRVGVALRPPLNTEWQPVSRAAVAVASRCAPGGHRAPETATRRISAVSATRGELTGRHPLAILALAPSPDAGRRLSGRRTAPALRRAGRRRNLEPATEPIQAVRDPGRGRPPRAARQPRGMPVDGGYQEQLSRLVRCCPVKQEPAGHATAWRRHRTPRTGALTTVDDAPASHLNREGGSTRADRGAVRSWAPGCPPSSETTRAATPTRRPACTTPAGRRSPVPRVRPSPGTCSGPTHARPLLHLRPDRCRRRSSGPSRLQGDRGRGNDRPGRPV